MNEGKSTAAEAVSIFEDYLAETHRRRTPERFVILEAAMSLRRRFTAEDLQRKLLDNGQRLSLPTVYSTLQMLTECSLLSRIAIDGRAALYQKASRSRNHTLCILCGKVTDIKNPQLEEIVDHLSLPGFRKSHSSLTVYGVCTSCIRKERKSNRKSKK